MPTYWWLVPVAYVMGSIPWGLLIVRAARGIDVREYGSGKTGVTNVYRTAGRRAALVVLAADASKGTATVLLARALTSGEGVHAAVAAAVVIGHVWPIFAGFRGGRGIATGIGSAAALDPFALPIGLVAFLPAVGLTRFVSFGSVLSVIAVVAMFGLKAATDQAPIEYLWYALGTGSLIVAMHRDNICRLLRGTEHRLGQRDP